MTVQDAGAGPAARRVWVVNQYARPDDVGGSRHRTMVRLLRQRGYDSTLVVGTSAPLGPPLEGVRYHAVPILPSRGNGLTRVLSMASFAVGVLRTGFRHRRARPDLVIGSSPHLFGAAAACALARAWRIPFVMEIRDLWPRSIQVMMDVSERHPLIVLFAAIERYLYRSSDAFVLLFGGAAEHVEEIRGAPAPHVVIPNGLDLGEVGCVPWPGRDRSGPLRVGYVGAVGVPNSLITLVDAAWALQRAGHRDRVLIDVYGEGVERERLTRLAEERELSNVRFHDPVPKSQVPSLLADHDVLVLCWKDSPLYDFGVSANKMADYFAAARPVINCLRSAHDPVARAGAGWTVPPEDPEALAEALLAAESASDETLRERGAAARRFALQNYDWRTNVTRLSELLGRVVDPGSAQPGLGRVRVPHGRQRA